MTDPKQDDFSDLERRLAVDAARKRGEDAKKPVIDAGDIVQGAVTLGTRAVVKGAIVGATAVVRGVVQAQDELAAEQAAREKAAHPEAAAHAAAAEVTGANVPAAAPAPANDSEKKNWFERKRDALDAKVHDLANSKTPLRYRFLLWGARQAGRFWGWSGRTYPHVLRPVRWAAHKWRDSIHKKIQAKNRQPNDWEKLGMRALSIGEHNGPLAHGGNRVMNIISAGFGVSMALTGLVGGAWNYGTYTQMDDVHISNVLRGDNGDDDYSTEIHGYFLNDKGERVDEIFIEAKTNPFYAVFYPENLISGIKPGDVCSFGLSGSPLRFSKFFAIPLPWNLSKQWKINPTLVWAHCVGEDDAKFAPTALDYMQMEPGASLFQRDLAGVSDQWHAAHGDVVAAKSAGFTPDDGTLGLLRPRTPRADLGSQLLLQA